jgi:hypothetical protein
MTYKQKVIQSFEKRLEAAKLRQQKFIESGNDEAAHNVGNFIEWCNMRIETWKERKD